MTPTELRTAPTRPDGLSAELVALWHEATGDWDRAHQVVQDLDNADAAWVHAYLHRREGDQSNARYWYTRAGKPLCHLPLDDEWIQIAETLLAGRHA
jgi:hypothetical protein